MSPAAPTDAAATPARSAWFALGTLGWVYLLNFLDRTLIYILFGPIKQELVFDDLQLALLGSTSFVLFYTTLGLPFGRLADRVSRKRLIAAGLVTWSLFSGLTGFADDFWTLFGCRVMVGVGEATLGPAAMSLLSDLFPAARRGTVQSVYSAGIPLGAATAFFLGGHVGATWGWRHAFWFLGFPGVALAIVVLLLPEPRRSVVAGERTDWRPLLRNAPLRWHVLGYAMLAVASNSLSIWVPSLLGRVHGVALSSIGNMTGLAMATTGSLGTAAGGWLADRYLARGGERRRMGFGGRLALACAPFWLLLLYAPGMWAVYLSYFALAGLSLAWLGPAAADVHDLVGPRLRGVGIAAYFLVVNLIGYGAAPPVIGWLSDRLGGPEELRTALLLCPAACVAAALLLLRGEKVPGVACCALEPAPGTAPVGAAAD